jgi:hypothetical protein
VQLQTREVGVASVQAQLEQFHEAIKLRRFKENQTLREKRDAVLDKLLEELPAVFAANDEEYHRPEFRDQGSYEMGTGVKPLGGDYDIDQGVYFPVGTDDYPDPVVLKQRVRQALDGYTKEVSIRRSCVTVFYQRAGEHLYHVDLAVYADGSGDADGKARLAKGKENSDEAYRVWEVSDPKGLKDTIFAKFEGVDRDQFRRVVRYLKRWRDFKFAADGNAAPLGIGLTIAAYDEFQPVIVDRTAGKADDLAALQALIGTLLDRFSWVWDADEQQLVRRLSVFLPVEPRSDLFVRMTGRQMAAFEDKLKMLKAALDEASTEIDPVDACEALQQVFGGDFPVPARAETAKRLAPAIVSSSSSA